MDGLQLLQEARARGASDLHLSCGQPPMLRIDGRLQALALPPATDDDLARWLRPWVDEQAWQHLLAGQEVDATWQSETVVEPAAASVPEPSSPAPAPAPAPARYRLNLFRHRAGLAAAIRLIPLQIPSLQALHAPAVLSRLCERPHGLGPDEAGTAEHDDDLASHLSHDSGSPENAPAA